MLAKMQSSSLAGIVIPQYASAVGRVVIYRTPKLLSTWNGLASGSFVINSVTVPGLPNSAIGVFVHVDAATKQYFALDAPNDLATPPAGIERNFLQIGVNGGYTAPSGRHFHESNIFFLPLKSGQTHTVNWEVSSPGESPSFIIYCLGYME